MKKDLITKMRLTWNMTLTTKVQKWSTALTEGKPCHYLVFLISHHQLPHAPAASHSSANSTLMHKHALLHELGSTKWGPRQTFLVRFSSREKKNCSYVHVNKSPLTRHWCGFCYRIKWHCELLSDPTGCWWEEGEALPSCVQVFISAKTDAHTVLGK